MTSLLVEPGLPDSSTILGTVQIQKDSTHLYYSNIRGKDDCLQQDIIFGGFVSNVKGNLDDFFMSEFPAKKGGQCLVLPLQPFLNLRLSIQL